MKTTGSELRRDASIYAEGTPFKTDELIREYNSYCTFLEDRGTEPLDFERWMEVEYPEYC